MLMRGLLDPVPVPDAPLLLDARPDIVSAALIFFFPEVSSSAYSSSRFQAMNVSEDEFSICSSIVRASSEAVLSFFSEEVPEDCVPPSCSVFWCPYPVSASTGS